MLKKLNRINATSTQLRPVKVLQFGDGNFLRGFADWIIDILNEKMNFNGDVQIVRPLRKGSSKKKDDQDGLYHVAVLGLQNGKMISETRLITCISGFVDPYDNREAFLQAAENPQLKFVVSNTTESGIVFSPDDHGPDQMPDSFPGKVAVLLYHRFNTLKGDKSSGLVFLPCELIEKNGDALKSVVLQYCSHWKLPSGFVQWVDECNTFCNTLVDRIVPGFPKETIGDLQSKIGYEDNQVVSAEPFHLWVIEAPEEARKLFPADKAGLSVIYAKDLSPYRTQKVRILNGAHTALTPLAYLRGLRTVRESVEDNYCGAFIKKTIFEEIIPTLDSPPDELNQFAKDVLERFQNPFIRHELKSIALNSTSKFKVRVLPSILEYHRRTGNLPTNLVLSFAAMIRFYKGEWRGENLPVNDSADVVSFFNEVWKSNNASHVATSVLANKSLWGEDLTKIEGMVESVNQAMNMVERSF
ncbi:MAG TPA: tagaturonate reductase [Chryseolinea sp.]|nr:tagaturonate reductase [Chryseolinea sp.]